MLVIAIFAGVALLCSFELGRALIKLAWNLVRAVVLAGRWIVFLAAPSAPPAVARNKSPRKALKALEAPQPQKLLESAQAPAPDGGERVKIEKALAKQYGLDPNHPAVRAAVDRALAA